MKKIGLKSHHHYTLFSVGAEYLMAVSLHVLPEFHLSLTAKFLGAGTFILYSLVSANYFRRTLSEAANETNDR